MPNLLCMGVGLATGKPEIYHPYDPSLCTFCAEHETKDLKTRSEVLRERDANTSQISAKYVPTPGSMIDVSLLYEIAEEQRMKELFTRKGMRWIGHG